MANATIRQDVAGFSNELTDAELERLAILSEELGEAQQCIGKILRHGYESYNPIVDTGLTNRRELERELGDIQLAISFLCDARDVNLAGVIARRNEKRMKIQRWLHFNDATATPDTAPMGVQMAAQEEK